MLGEQTFAPDKVRQVTQGKPVTRSMSYGGTIVKAMFFLALTIGFAVLGWRWAMKVQTTSGLWFFLGYLLLIGISIAAVGNPRLAAGAGLLYAVLMGLWMGSISRIYEAYYDGIVGQALLTSVAVFAACLFLYSFRFIRVTGRFVRFVLISLVGIGFTYLVGWLLSLFGIRLNFFDNPSSVGIGISLFIVLIAAFSLILDFASIESGVKAGAPKAFEWYCAFALLSTLVWLYLEVLRLLARTRR
jgi:uncharacterized YccA/Bax inhibitor family protein